jgi:hypothetical protein
MDRTPQLIRGAKLPLRPMHVWAIRVRLQIERRLRDLALFDVALDSKLRVVTWSRLDCRTSLRLER